MELIRWILLLTALAGIGARDRGDHAVDVNMPVAASAVTAGLGILVGGPDPFRIISPPDGGVGDLDRRRPSIGVFLGLIAAAGVAIRRLDRDAGGGTSFGAPPGGTAATRRRRPPPSRRTAQPRSGGRVRAAAPGRPFAFRAAAFGRPSSSARGRRAACATRAAIAMMVIIGLTPIELGNRLASAT